MFERLRAVLLFCLFPALSLLRASVLATLRFYLSAPRPCRAVKVPVSCVSVLVGVMLVVRWVNTS